MLDRLSRNEGDQGAVYHHADRHGVVIELASQDYDESEQARTMRSIVGLHAHMEHMDIRRRTQRGRRARVASGKLLAGAYPLYGYLWGDPAKGQRTYQNSRLRAPAFRHGGESRVARRATKY